MHLEPCYKKFKSIQRNSFINTVGLFPKTCVFCNQQRKPVNKTVYTLHKITTNDAEELVKKAAEIKNDEQLLLRIRGPELIT